VRLHHLSLKAKLGLSGAIGMLIVLVLMTTWSLWALRKDVEQSIATAQGVLAEGVANDLDDKIEDRKKLLALNAAVLSRSALMSSEQLQTHFSHRPFVHGVFDTVFVADKSGRIIYDTPELPGRRGVSVANRDYFKSAVGKGALTLSEPVAGKSTHEPNIVIAAPIRSSTGEVIGMLGGTIYLSRPNFISALGTRKNGVNGYFALISKGENPLIVMHRQRDRIMKPALDAKARPQLAKALNGYEGTAELVNSVGLPALITYKSLRSSPWVLITVFPTDEAYAALRATEREMLALGAFLALLSGAFIWWFTARLLSPLDKLTRQMEAQMEDLDTPLESIQANSKELVDVLNVYNALMQRKRLLREAAINGEQKYRSILTHAGDAFISLDAQGNIAEWNRQAEETFGWLRSEAVGQRLSSLIIPPDQRAMHDAGMNRFSRVGQGPRTNKRLQLTALHRSGREIPVELTVSAERDSQGNYVANAFLHDITEREASENRIKESEKRLRMVADSMPALIGYIDAQERYRLTNAFYKTFLGIDPSDMLGKTVHEVLGDEGYELVRKQIALALKGKRVHFEQAAKISGSAAHLMINYIPDIADDGAVLGFYTMVMDISERKRIETLKTDFISTVSHELRTPLTSIRGSLGLLVGGAVGEIPKRAQVMLEIANNNCQRLVRLINDILDIEKIESGNMQFNMVRQPMLPVVEAAIIATQSYAEQFQVQIVLEPTTTANVHVAIDADRITQVIVNLLSNAVKFSEAGSRVDVMLTYFPEHVRLSVFDQGKGIPEAFRSRIFQKFAQADSSDSREKGGTGLGLNICQAIIERHQGSINFHSELNVGSEFYFDLPLMAA
jgi:PAS domain S-box-containing protein